MELLLRIKPSQLGRYYETQCDRFLVYYSVDKSEYSRLGWDEPKEFKANAAMLAGIEWEKILYQRLKDNPSCEVQRLKDKRTNRKEQNPKRIVETLKNLKTTDKPIYIYQACIQNTASFKDYYHTMIGDCGDNVSLSSRMYPDFLKAEYSPIKGKYCLTVIDAKNASVLRVGAQIQIALYVKSLKYLLEDENITNCYVNEEEGIVWNREKITDNCIENLFDLRDTNEELNKFFSEKLVNLCNSIIQSTNGIQLHKSLKYCVSAKCEHCDSFGMCRMFCAENCSVRMMPYISVGAQQRLDELIIDKEIEDDSLESIRTALLSKPHILTDNCYYWNNVKNNLYAYEEGLLNYYDENNVRFPKASSSISFPISQNFIFLLTAQQDALSGRIYAYAWLLIPGKGIDIWNQGLSSNGYVQIYEGKENKPGKGTYYDSVVAHSETEDEFNRIDRLFVERVYGLLERISDYPEKDRRKMQCFVMDGYEKSNIETSLYYMLETLDPEKESVLIEKVMSVLSWIQGKRLVTDANFGPEEFIENPVTVISSEISKLYVLSKCVEYNLKSTASIFSPDFNFDDDKSDYIGMFSNVLDGTPIIRAWKERDKERKKQRISSIAQHLRRRLFVESRIISAIQGDNEKGIKLSSWPASYQLQKPKQSKNVEIARLDFENRYEQLLEYNAIRSIRVAGIQNAIDNGHILWLEYSGSESIYKILNHDSYIGKKWFTAWLCEDNPENRTQIMVLKDAAYTGNIKIRSSAQYKVKDTETVFYPAQEYTFVDDGKTAIVNFIPRKKSGFIPRKGGKYLLFEVYTDINSPKTGQGISKLIERPELLDPKSITGKSDVIFDSRTEQICSQYWSPDRNAFSDSQKEAFIHLLERKLTVLVGPPASGKTDFISRAIITIASYYKMVKGKDMKIMVTAMSHSAIDNVLIKTARMLSKGNTCGINVYKADKYDDELLFEGTSVRLLKPRTVAATMRSSGIQIIGMTCWSAYKEFHEPESGNLQIFDIVVMDEASQIRAMDAFLTLECSDKNTRYLLVGDDDQLPPIINGKYKETEGQKYIYGSVFHMFITGLGIGHPDIVRLSDNFRMNAALCRYPAKAIYGDSYKAFDKKIATQTIKLLKPIKNELISEILDPDYPLVFCELFGKSREQTIVEIKIVTMIISELWNYVVNIDSGLLASKEGNFWRECIGQNGRLLDGACGIISPHHEHINRLRSSIAGVLGQNGNEIYIGTVDKLQGKERSTVIVSYGVSEPEKIANESEFIFSRNRFNVSLTRGKAKTIVLLSDAIAESNMMTSSMAAVDNNLRKGFDFIHGFARYMQTAEDDEDIVSRSFLNLTENVSLKLWKKRTK
ncbi:AAA domain-containing protein [Butyrivibrio sp. ob235]|uniref:DEAD/DEAH box helicase n=1 Tax=Butyrivibrio sp. ob235 TaxID=1761780 RepID=UPI0008CA6248|nr:AAA domain-containing protein [Butyrivibrio sp. ob235]SEM18799.1 AAA domain-containing protein [Butyrivibrio sp. ob235]